MIQNSISFQRIALLMVIFILSIQAQTYAPPPTIAPSDLLTIPFTTNGSIIQSQRL